MDKSKKGPKHIDTKKLEEEKEQYKQNYLRALADYHNLEKRVKDEKEQTVRNASQQLVIRLIGVLDNFEKAEVFIKDEGLKMIKKQLEDTLKEEGLEEVGVLGQEYDPHIAEAIEVEESDKDNIVLEVYKKGYKLNGNILRPAQVKVGKKS